MAFTWLVLIHPALAERKLALVIGINEYAEVPKLEKAVGDARAIASRMSQLGFETTTSLDADRRSLNLALSKFYATIEPGDSVLVHFSGHGIEIDSQNYLLPADIPSPENGQVDLVKSEAIPLASIVDTLATKGAGTSILIIDACRNNPFESAGKRSLGGTRGLAVVEPSRGTFVMYSAGSKEAALDRLNDTDQSQTSVYTRVLLNKLQQPNITLRGLAVAVRQDVEKLARSVGHQQRPAYYDDLPGDFTFGGPSAAQGNSSPVMPATEPVASPQPSTPPPSVSSELDEKQAYDLAGDINTAEAWDVFIAQFPEGKYAAYARAARSKLSHVASANPNAPPSPSAGQEDGGIGSKSDSNATTTRSRWVVVLGSYPKNQLAKAQSRRRQVVASGYNAVIIDSDDYGRLAPGLYVVVLQAATRDQAKRLQTQIRNIVGDAYAKQAF